jgi:hypothetical protein
LVRRLRVPASTSALPCITGTVVSTWRTRRSASASAIVSGRIVRSMPGMPCVVVRPGLMPIKLVPNCVNSDSTN